MHLSGVLRIVNILIVLAAIVLAGAGWWYIVRPSPDLSGSASAPVGASVTIVRDSHYRPHITASSIDDALFAQGYVTAQERLWQMDMLRRLAAGEISEVAGRSAIELDTNARKLQLGRIAAYQAAQISPTERRAMAAYARGVNHFIDTHRGRLSWEFELMGYQPRPWRIADSLLAILEMDRVLTNSWEADLQKGVLLASGNADLVRRLFPSRFGPDAVEGSNAFAVSGANTASGKPLLAGDPHLEFTVPSPWFPIHIKAPGLDVAGAAYVGLPGVAIGHNHHIAWSVTNLEFDSMDLYAERIDLRTGRYEYQGQIRQAALQRDHISVKGERGVEILTWVTNHGPVITSSGGQAYSVRWTAAHPDPYSVPIVELNQARDWQEFRSALSSYSGPSFNWVFASRDGHIGYQAAGRLPFRKGFTGDAPLDGAAGTFEWAGMARFEQLPTSFDPPSGRIVSANQDPFDQPVPYEVNGRFSAPFRSRQIRALLASGRKLTPSDLVKTQKDVYSGFHHAFARIALGAARAHGGTLASDAAVLIGWNGQMELGQPGPLLAELFYRQVRLRLAERAAGRSVPGLSFRGSAASVLHIVETRPRGWFDNWDDMLAEALGAAISQGRRQHGTVLAKWNWGNENRAFAPHPIARTIKFVAPYFNIGPFPSSGSSQSVKQTGGRILPSMRFVADTANWDQSLLILPSGQSGHVVSGHSRHYKDEWDDFSNGRARPLLFLNVRAESTFTLQPSSQTK